ncbi:MAG: hypothetical protein IPJ78_19040 [Gemmatimonadetes bacterium]|nr:hypothetical protein [Gemmatimonadota bacterium]
MRSSLLVLALLSLTAAPAFAAEAGAKPRLLDPHLGLMTWTIIVFVLLLGRALEVRVGPDPRGRERSRAGAP